jgi:hypothetical protein
MQEGEQFATVTITGGHYQLVITDAIIASANVSGGHITFTMHGMIELSDVEGLENESDDQELGHPDKSGW